MNKTSCRWGILGAAFIARKNWQAIRDAGNAQLAAVASRDEARAAAFIAECQASAPHDEIPEAIAGYEALLSRKDIDAVYIPLPTGLRKEWVLKAAQAGKHVLVEKPVGVNAAEVAEMIEACRQHHVQFMDGVMFMHGRRLHKLRDSLRAAAGEVRHIASQFSFMGGEEFNRTNIRAHGLLEPLGCLGDLGWYCIRLTLCALDYQMPLEVTGRIHAENRQTEDAPPVPVEFSATLTFPGGVTASFYCSFTAANAQWAVVSGTEGVIQLSDFVLPFSGAETRFSTLKSEFLIKGCRFDMHEARQETSIGEPSSNARGSQESEMFRTFSNLVLGQTPDPTWPEITLKTQKVLDACLRSARQGGAAEAP